MNSAPLEPLDRVTYQVSELAEILRGLLEDSLPSVWVQGEISNFSRPASGHWYFTLKDGSAQLRCAMFKNRNFNIRPAPRDGDVVRVRATVSLYIGRGDLQLICDALEAAGEGALLAALERLKKKLAAEGLFDASRKRPLPALPHHIGVITSATGAAVQDIRATLARRFPLAQVWLYPVPVQGLEAPPAIVKALQELPLLAPIDVLILARGGGSLEDLWAFNDEAVVRAVAACTVPVVSGVGHEVDFSLADFAADLRAATPTAAAEAITPDALALLAQLSGHASSLKAELEATLLAHQRSLANLGSRVQAQNPTRRLQEQAQRLDELAERLLQAGAHIPLRAISRYSPLAARLIAASPLAAITASRRGLDALQQRLQLATGSRLERRTGLLVSIHAKLDALNPTAVLARGYAIAVNAQGAVVRDAAALTVGEPLTLRFARGGAEAAVTAVSGG